MKQLLTTLLIALVSITSITYAQEETQDETIVLETQTETSVDVTTNEEQEEVLEEGPTEETIEYSEDLGYEEALEIINQAEKPTEEELAEEIYAGEVVVTTEDFIVLETEEDQYVKIPVTHKNGGQRRRTGNFIKLSSAEPNYVLTVVPEESNQIIITKPVYSNGTISNKSGTKNYTLNSETKVIRNGNISLRSELESLKDGSTVTVITDKEGEVVAVSINESPKETPETTTSNRWVWITGAIIALITILGIIFK